MDWGLIYTWSELGFNYGQYFVDFEILSNLSIYSINIHLKLIYQWASTQSIFLNSIVG